MGFIRENWGILSCDECSKMLMRDMEDLVAPLRDLLETADCYGWLILDRPRRYYCTDCRAKHEREATREGRE